MAWSDAFLKVLKDNDVRLVTYVPDNVWQAIFDSLDLECQGAMHWR